MLNLWFLPLISLLAVFLALLIYVIIWKKHNIHGWTQFAFLISAFLFFLISAIRKYQNFEDPNKKIQVIETLFTFFTMGHCTNLINLSANIFWTFLKLEPECPIVQIGDLSALFKSLAICWGFAAVITLAELFVSSNDVAVYQIELISLVFLICLNFTIVLAIATVIYKRVKEGARLKGHVSQENSFRAMLSLALRLFLITGLIWTVKAIPLMLIRNVSEKRGAFWSVVGVLGDMYGITLFIAFIYNTRVLNSLKDFPTLRKVILFGCGDSKRSVTETKHLMSPSVMKMAATEADVDELSTSSMRR